MKLNKIALAVIAAAAVPMAANAGVTVTPILLGYHYNGQAHDEQRDVLRTGKNLYENANGQKIDNRKGNSNGGVTQESGLYTGAALGIELTPSTQFQVEYGVSNTNAEASEASAKAGINRFDAEQETISGNFLIGTDQFTGYNTNSFRPYVLVGAGQSKISVENQQTYTTSNGGTTKTQTGKSGQIKAGTEVAESKDTIGNLGLGAMYRVNDALSLRGEARAIHNFDNNWWEGMALAGMEVVLGGHLAPTVVVAPIDPVEVEEVVVEEPVVEVEQPVVVVEQPPVIQIEQPQPEVDSDGDGVPDSRDACPNTPTNLVVDARGCPKQVDVTEALQMELRVFFDNDKTTIKPQFQSEIAKVAEKMREYPNATANIEGHASKTGPSARYNQRLSEARAMAVKSMLANQYGIAPNRMTTVGYGYTRPLVTPQGTPEAQVQNRRVYATITGDKTVTVDQTKDMDVQ
ncbi:OmpA family protein [Psychrobacter sp. I-STPA10]|uniref:OmpA family protein n=1 Tax=Psychrobacter sp. I-STPA10 TaxID=2585769 RepID=UPI001E3A2224|nr:OmpA family protein [Psychrobacter sp. I-STPA10]